MLFLRSLSWTLTPQLTVITGAGRTGDCGGTYSLLTEGKTDNLV